jgi:3-oxoadipate enol-lactonase
MPSFIYKAAVGAFAGPTARPTRPEFLEFLHFPLRDGPKLVAWALRSILIGRRDEHELPTTARLQPMRSTSSRRRTADETRSAAVSLTTGRSGHFVPEERPEALMETLAVFLK